MTTAFAQTAPAPGTTAEAPRDALDTVNTDPRLVLEKIEGWAEGFWLLLPNLAVAAFVFLAIFAVGWAVQWSVVKWARRRRRESLGDVLGGFLKWIIAALGFMVALTIILPSVKPVDLLAGLGVGSVAIGFAFKDILQNWLAGLLLLVRQPFKVGDQIVVKDYEGTVERIETRSTNLRTYDGRRVLIPNAEVYTNAVIVNTAYTKRRSEYDVGIGYGDDVRTACEVILKAIAGLEGIEKDPPPEALPWRLDASWVTIRVYWWTHSRRADVIHVQARVIEAVKYALDAAGIDMPFETVQTLWHDQTEETDGIRGFQREGWPRPRQGKPPRPAREVEKAEAS